MKNAIVLFILTFTLLSFAAFSQTDYTRFYRESMSVNNTGMYILGSWAVLNIATGAAGWTKGSGENKYFHQMNLFWNTVNLGIAGFALISNAHADPSVMSPDEMLDKHVSTERLYLINAGLDVLYIGTGVLLKSLSHSSSKRPELLAGYGNSIILQGGFLLLFDAILFGIQHSHRMQFLESHTLSFEMGLNTFRITLAL